MSPGARQAPWTLTWTEKALDDAGRLPRNVRERIVREVEDWAATSRGDLLPLVGIAAATHRLRVGDWRVFLTLDGAQHGATVRRVCVRGSAYQP